MDRKTFIIRAARGGLLVSLAATAGILLTRRQVSLEQDCGTDLPCRNCGKLNSCRLPAAEKARSNEKG